MEKLTDYLTVEGWNKDWNETKRRAKKGLEEIAKIAKAPYNLYKNNKLININANVLAAAYPGIEAAAYISKRMEETGFSDSATSAGAIAADFVVYVPVHLGMHYLSNKGKFKNEENTFDSRSFWKDTGMVYLTQLPSIGLFYFIAGPLQYGLMKAGLEAETANRISFWGTLAATRAVHTLNYWQANRWFGDDKSEEESKNL